MLNISSNKTLRDPHYRSHVTIIAQVTSLGLLGVIIVLGNLASIVTFIKTQSLRRRSNYLIINLSVADLFVGFVDFTIMQLFLTGIQFNVYVISLEFLDTATGMTSILIMSTIAVERFYAIYNPFSHRMLRFKSYVGISLFPWLISISACSLYLVAYLSYPPLLVLSEVYFFLIPIILALALLIIVIAYIAIWLKSRQANPSAQNQNRVLRDRKLAATLFVVTFASLVTWLPNQCLQQIVYYCKKCPLPHMNYFFAVKFLQYLNSGLNFFIYMQRMPEFRSAFLLLVKCSRKPSANKTPTAAITNGISDITLGITENVEPKPSGSINFGFYHRKSYILKDSFKDEHSSTVARVKEECRAVKKNPSSDGQDITIDSNQEESKNEQKNHLNKDVDITQIHIYDERRVSM